MWKELITFLWLTALSVCDIKKRAVPILLLYFGAILTGSLWIYRGIIGDGSLWELLKALLPGILLLVIAKATEKAGTADGIILMILGGLEGYINCLYISLGGLTLAALTAGMLLIFKKVKRNTKIPFVPFLTMGWVLTICGS